MKTQFSLLIGLVLLLSGCKSLELAEPIGTPIKQPLDAGQYGGKWLLHMGDETIPFVAKVDDAASGTLSAAWVVDADKNKFIMHTADAAIREIGSQKIVNLKVYPQPGEKDKKAEWILFGRIETKGNKGLIWYPNIDEFEKLIKAGKLPGETKSNEIVRLGKLEPAHLDLITSNTASLFLWDQPMILEKLK